MNESEMARLESDFLAGARAALSPSPEREQHILQQTTSRLAAVAGGAMAAAEGATAPAATAAPKALFSLKALVGVSLASLAAGFAGGYLTSSADEREPMEANSHVPHTIAVPAMVPVREPGEVEGAEAIEPPAPVEEEPSASVASALRKVERDVTENSEEARPTLYAEMSYVRRAQKALRAGNPALALGLMMTLDEKQPEGALRSERNVTTVLSLCALDRQAEATAIARRTLKMNAGRLYEARLRSSCAQLEKSTSTGDGRPSSATPTNRTEKELNENGKR